MNPIKRREIFLRLQDANLHPVINRTALVAFGFFVGSAGRAP